MAVNEMADVRITVIKKLKTDEVFKMYARDGMPKECGTMKEGVEYITKGMGMPEGFCPWAWADIQRDVVHISLGGEYPWVKGDGVMITCCTDGLRPVVFKLERIEEEEKS